MDEIQKAIDKYSEKKKFIDKLNNPEPIIEILNTCSAFLLATLLYVVVNGFANDFSIKALINWKGGLNIFLGGLGIIWVQNNGMLNGAKRFFTHNELFNRYRKENIEISDQISDIDFKTKFITDQNNNELEIEIEKITTKEIEKLKKAIYNINSSMFLLKGKKKVKAENEVKLLQNELDYILENGVSLDKLTFRLTEIDDIFNSSFDKNLKGQAKYNDDSDKIQIKSNIQYRIYMPIVLTLLKGVIDIDNFKSESWWGLIIFVITLTYSWGKAYARNIELKVKKAIPAERNKNTALKDALSKYEIYKLKGDDLVSNLNEEESTIKESI